MIDCKPLLDFIANAEHGGHPDYNAVWGGIKAKDRPTKKLTEMTIGDVLDWQDMIDPHYKSEAAGRYQIMEDTLRGLYPDAGLSVAHLFSAENQDRLATQLLRRRGLGDYIAGRLSAERFANNLAKEWASLPCVSGEKKGRSYYSGDGLNQSLVDIEPFLDAVKRVLRYN